MNQWTNHSLFDRKLEHVTPINMFIPSYTNPKYEMGIVCHISSPTSIQPTNQSKFFDGKLEGR